MNATYTVLCSHLKLRISQMQREANYGTVYDSLLLLAISILSTLMRESEQCGTLSSFPYKAFPALLNTVTESLVVAASEQIVPICSLLLCCHLFP